MGNNTKILSTRQLNKYKKLLNHTKILNNLKTHNNTKNTKNNKNSQLQKYILMYSIFPENNVIVNYLNWFAKIKNLKIDKTLVSYKLKHLPAKTQYDTTINIYNLTQTEADAIKLIEKRGRIINPQIDLGILRPILTKNIKIEQGSSFLGNFVGNVLQGTTAVLQLIPKG